MNEISEIQNAFEEMQTVLSAFATIENFGRIDAASAMMASAVQQGGKIIACGNGGSMSDAMHFAEELSGRFRDDRQQSIRYKSRFTHRQDRRCIGGSLGYRDSCAP